MTIMRLSKLLSQGLALCTNIMYFQFTTGTTAAKVPAERSRAKKKRPRPIIPSSDDEEAASADEQQDNKDEAEVERG